MGHPVRYRVLDRSTRAALLAVMSVVLLNGHERAALAASPYQQTRLACSNGDSGDDAACKRLCRLFINQKNNPLGDMRATCLRRLDKKRNILTDPD